MGLTFSLLVSYLDGEREGGAHMRALVDYAALRPGAEPCDRSGKYRPCGKVLEAEIRGLCRMHPDLMRTPAYLRYLCAPDVTGAVGVLAEARTQGFASGDYPLCLEAPQGSLPLSHGLFTMDGFAVRPDRLASRLERFPGRVFHMILGLDRRDAEISGLRSAQAWTDFLRAEVPALALAFNIPLEEFRFYGAFHNKETGADRPHVHVLVLSAGASRGFISEEGKAWLRARLTEDMGHLDLCRTYVPLRGDEMRSRRRALAAHAAAIRARLKDEEYAPSPGLYGALRALGPACAVFGKEYSPEERGQFRRLVGRILHELYQDGRVRDAYRTWLAFQKELNVSAQTGCWPDAQFAVRKDLKKVRTFVTRYAREVACVMGDDAALRLAARELFRGVCEELSRPVCVHARSGSYHTVLPEGAGTVRMKPETGPSARPVMSPVLGF